MFIDDIKVYARAGHGGKGSVAFTREAYRPKGGPSGGNGGRGGNVILQADHDLNNLIQQYYVPRLIAQTGEAGMGKGMDGHAGKDLIIKVPCGTVVWRLTPKAIPGLTVDNSEASDEQADKQRTQSTLHATTTRGACERLLDDLEFAHGWVEIEQSWRNRRVNLVMRLVMR